MKVGAARRSAGVAACQNHECRWHSSASRAFSECHTMVLVVRGAPRICSKGGPEQKFSYICTGQKGAKYQLKARSTTMLQACSVLGPPTGKNVSHTCCKDATDIVAEVQWRRVH